MVDTYIPLDYVRKYISVGWPEALWALAHGFLTTKDMVDLAKDKLERGSEDWREIELINFNKNDTESLLETVKKLASEGASPNEEFCKERWNYLFVKWNYENQPFDVYYKNLFDFYFEGSKPKALEILLNFRPPGSIGAAEQRNQTMKIANDFLRANEARFLKR